MHINSSEHLLLLLLLLYVCVHAQLYPTLCDPMNCNLPGSYVHGVSQARVLKWVVFSPSRISSRPWDRTHVSCFSYVGRWILYHWVTWEANIMMMMMKKEDSVLFALLNLAFFSLQYTLKIIHCPYIFVNVNEVIPNAFPIIKIATLKITVLCICSVIFID